MRIKKILVPVDFSEYSDKAVDYALPLAEKFKAEIALLHVTTLFHEDADEKSRMKDYASIVRNREQLFQDNIKRHESAAHKRGVTLKSILLRGFSPADTILDHIQENNFNLVVMGSHGRTGIKHLLLGSVSEKVVRLSNIPVLTVHHSIEKFDLKTILVPIDFSKFSKIAIDRALSLAKLFGTKLIFLHVIEQIIHPAFYAASIESIFQVDSELKTRTEQKLRQLVKDSGIESEYLVMEGKAYKEIVDCAKEKNVDLIVMATRGLTGLDYFLMGGTAERVVRMAECQVLTVARTATENAVYND